MQCRRQTIAHKTHVRKFHESKLMFTQKFTCSNFRVLVVGRENRENLDLAKISRYTVWLQWNQQLAMQLTVCGCYIACTYVHTDYSQLYRLLRQTKHQKLSQWFCLFDRSYILSFCTDVSLFSTKYVYIIYIPLCIPQAAQSGGAIQSAGAPLFVATLLLVTMVALYGFWSELHYSRWLYCTHINLP